MPSKVVTKSKLKTKQNKNYEYTLESETIAHDYIGHFMINKGKMSLIFDNIFYDV